MSRLRSALARVAALGRSRRRQDVDLDDEIASHLAEAAEDFVARGLSADEARRAALRAFGGVVHAKESYRQSRSFAWMDALGQDLRRGEGVLVDPAQVFARSGRRELRARQSVPLGLPAEEPFGAQRHDDHRDQHDRDAPQAERRAQLDGSRLRHRRPVRNVSRRPATPAPS